MFIKENFIGKEEAETVAKIKLVRKIRKHNQLYFGTLVLLLQSYPIQNVGWRRPLLLVFFMQLLKA